MQHKIILLFYCCFLTLAGCQSALLQMQNENSERELRITQKEQHVSELELQNRYLQEEKIKLQKDLETTRLNLDQLAGRLKAIQIENDRIQAITPKQLNKQKQDSLRLKKYRDEIELLMSDEQFAFDERGSKSDKQKRIDELREEIKLYLQFGLE